jgi:HAD superfamily hydrolase (TIGR01509 family)
MNKEKKEIELVMFDLGNVILNFDHMTTCNKLAGYSKKDSSYIYDFIFKSDLTKNYDRGKISSRDVFSAISDKLELQISFKKFNAIWSDIFFLNNGIEQLIRRVKTLTKIALLSNTDEMHFDYIRDNFEIISDFNFVFLSYKIGYMKPDTEIFEYAIDKTGISPEKIIYVDDIQDFVDAANKSGMNGICYTDIKTLKKDLEGYLRTSLIKFT